jgi:hypothetical protein
MRRRGDLLPHFSVDTLAGSRFSYSTIWQQRNLVLLLVSRTADGHTPPISEITSRQADFDAANTTCVVTADVVDGLPSPGVVVADRWGEIVHVAPAGPGEILPSPPSIDELLDWVRFTQMKCPECEGETK